MPNELIGYSLPVVNDGPWSYFESDGSGRTIEVQNSGPWSNFIIEEPTPPTPSDTAVVGTAIVGTAKAA